MDHDPAPSAAGAVSQEKPRSLWRNRDFALLWSGQAVSTLGTRMSALALPLLVLALTRSPAQAGLVAAARLLPYLLFSLPAGALVDRWNRKAVMIRCDLVRWLALGSVPLGFAFGRLSVAQLYLVAFVEGTAYVLFSLAEVSALPRVVPESQLPRAWSLNETSDASGQLLGPGVAGFIIGLARTTAGGAALAYLADSLSYLVSVISLRFIRVPFQAEREARTERRSLRADIAEGLIFLWRQRRLRILALLTMTVNFLQAPLTLAIIVLARGPLHIDVRTLGLIFSAGGVGGLVGAVMAPWLQRRLRFGAIVIGGVGVWALGVAALALANGAPLLMLGWAVVNVMWPLYAVVVVSYRLSLAPDALQGRANSAFRLLTFGAEPLGTALGGALLVPLGARALFWLLAAGLALCALAVSATELRKV
jgi:MFS family permease